MARHHTKTTSKHRCECADSGCPVHKGRSRCDASARWRMKRVDMDDRSGVLFCQSCADDAADSGVFGSMQPIHWR